MEDFDLNKAMQEQEANAGKVQSEAVAKAKENLAQKKLEKEAKEVESRLASAEREETDALKQLRFSRKKENAQNDYLKAISSAKAEFEASGNYQAYDKAVEKAAEVRDEAILNAKRAIYGDEYWRV